MAGGGRVGEDGTYTLEDHEGAGSAVIGGGACKVQEVEQHRCRCLEGAKVFVGIHKMQMMGKDGGGRSQGEYAKEGQAKEIARLQRVLENVR
jgi:hypothetical protein